MSARIRVFGEAQNRTVLGIFHAYLKLNSDATIDDLRQAFPDSLAPDKGVPEIFVNAGPDVSSEHYFTAPDEIVKTSDGKEIAIAKLWNKASYDNIVNQAAQYGIVVAEFEQQQQVGHKGSYYLEYVNGDSGAGDVYSARKKRGCLAVFWTLLCLAILILLLLWLFKSCNRDAPVSGNENAVESSLVVIESETVGEDVSSEAEPATTTDSENSVDSKATESGNTTAVTDAKAEIEKYQTQFDDTEYPVGQYQLKPEAKGILDNVVKTLNNNPGTKLTVYGYASREGNQEANLVLSEKRANAVVDYLESKGISSSRLKAVGKGISDPISKQLSPNRRIDFVLE